MDKGRHRARVLVIDEDHATRAAVSGALAAEGYEVRAELDGAAVEEAVSQFAPDLVILEARYQNGPNGYTVARRLRQAGDVPVVFLSAEDTPEARLAGFQAGADDYVSKPLALPELVARATAILRRSGRRSSGDVEVGEWTMNEALAPMVTVAGSSSGCPGKSTRCCQCWPTARARWSGSPN